MQYQSALTTFSLVLASLADAYVYRLKLTLIPVIARLSRGAGCIQQEIRVHELQAGGRAESCLAHFGSQIRTFPGVLAR